MSGGNRKYRARLSCRVTESTKQAAMHCHALHQALGLGRHWDSTLYDAITEANRQYAAKLRERGVDPESVLKAQPHSHLDCQFLECRALGIGPDVD